MSEPFVGEIRMFAGNFAPRGWAFCDGQLLAVSQNDALFSLLGTTYGGDGRTSFALPDLRGRIPLHMGQGPGLSARRIGEKAGDESVTLTMNQLPAHTHTVMASSSPAGQSAPVGSVPANTTGINLYAAAEPTDNFASTAVTQTGGSRPHTNMMPTLGINFIIALVGLYPSRH